MNLDERQQIISAIENLRNLTYCTSPAQDVVDECLMSAEFALLILEREKSI